DPYEDENYINSFRTILKALNKKQALKIHMVNRKGHGTTVTVMPQRLEYSEKDDKFRLISTGCRYGGTINIARITSCEIIRKTKLPQHDVSISSKEAVTLRILDERNSLERTLLHFANFEKQAERTDENRYLVHIKYNKADETELVIRILSFGPTVEVVAPVDFRNLIIDRLKKQKSCELI
ncbi:MAG: WYL domain-containing protein, partial [Acutalibacteraceae bacterium]|nr:WYL domain-containing protein [Acutalibacteraceae bacterium]